MPSSATPRTSPCAPPADLGALLLCGGQGSRMGGVDKGLQLFRGRPLVAHVHERIAPQVGQRVRISANRHLDDYAAYGHPVLPDTLPGFPGPLAGMLAGLQSLTEADPPWLLCVSGDSPWLPTDLAARLAAALQPGDLAAMALGREAPGQPLRPQPLACLLHRGLAPALAGYLARGERRVEAWLRAQPLALAAFDAPHEAQAFVNINDRRELERLA